MAFPSVTYTFTNGTTADATQVNQDFTDLINGMSDGTKSFSIAAITVAGISTLSGAVILGGSTGNDLTFNGSIASSIPVKTNTSFNIGTSTLGLAGVYLGGSSTFTCRVIAGTMSASYTLTLPITGGTTGMFPVTDGTGVLSFRYTDKIIATLTSNTTITTSETIVPCDATSGAFAVTLPAYSGNTGKRFIIRKVTTDVSLNAVTIKDSAAATVTTLNTQGESVELLTDGTSWFVLNRYIPSNFVAYTPTYNGFGTVTTSNVLWRRMGNCIHIIGSFATGTPTAAQAQVSLPQGLTSATTLFGTATINLAGPVTLGVASASTFIVNCMSQPTVTYLTFSVFNNANGGYSVLNGNGFTGAGEGVSFQAIVPIDGWNG